MGNSTATPEVSFDQKYFKSLAELSSTDQARCNNALLQFQKNPSHPSLRFGPLHGDPSGRLHKIRAADDIRILIGKEGNVHTFLLAGSRADIYERASRGRFLLSRGRNTIGFHDPGEEGKPGKPSQTHDRKTTPEAPERAVLDHWTDSELAEAGLTGAEIASLRTSVTESDLLTLLEDGWSESRCDLVFEVLEKTPEEWRNPSLDVDSESRFRDAIQEFGALHGISQLFTPQEVEQIAAAPIEDWMIFLHPDQRHVVERRFDGPARVRGSAGTGKTVVGLHRAAELARRTREQDPSAPPVLFTTFVKTLAPVLEQLFARIPGSPIDGVEFVHVDKLASEICREAGMRRPTNPRDVDAAWARAYDTVVVEGSPLRSAQLSRGYLREEVVAVVKGRGIQRLSEYLAVRRVGRRTRFTEDMRRQVWALRDAWDDEMAKRGTVDFCDIVALAADLARKAPEPRFSAAIIDEAQDVTLVGLQMVRSLVNGPSATDPPDGLTIIGDGAQRIYPGAFTLRQAGIEVRGRTTVLRKNYRNTQEVLSSAMAVAGRDSVVDLDEEFTREDEAGSTDRMGVKPVFVECRGPADEAEYMANRIRGLTSDGLLSLGDIGVFVPTNRLANDVQKHLEAEGIPLQALTNYDGVTTPEVKIGTYARAKGLEFKVVFLPRVDDGVVPRARTSGQGDAEYEDQLVLSIGQLFVAMTRARDDLVVLSTDEPSALIVEALESFDVVRR